MNETKSCSFPTGSHCPENWGAAEDKLMEERLTAELQKISEEDNNLCDTGVSVDAMVSSHLKKFYDVIRNITGGLKSVELEAPATITDPQDEHSDEESVEDQGECLEEYKDLVDDDFVKPTPSIEELMNSPEFISCLEKISDEDEMEESLDELIEAINRCMKEEAKVLSPESRETRTWEETSSKEVNDSSDELPDQEEKNSAEFKEFFGMMTEVARTDMKDIFEGDDLMSSEQFVDFCFQVFQKENLGTIDPCAEGTGPRYMLKPVKDDPEEARCTEKECEEMWNSLQRKSYYDCVKQNLDEAGLVEPLYRVLIVGLVYPEKRNTAKREYDSCIARIQESIMDAPSKITGVLVFFTNFFFHIVEASADGMEETISETADMVRRNILREAKVIDTTNEIPNRYFKYWKSVYVPRKERPLLARPEKISEAEILHKMKEFRKKIRLLASYVQTVLYDDFEEKMRSLMPLDVFPQEPELNYFFEDELFVTVQEYVDRYLSQPVFTSSEEFEQPPVKKFDVCQ